MARNRDLRAPHACTEGGCGSCRGLLVQGKVEMAGNNVLSEEELKSGLILTCQSKATTPEVVVNFDCVG
jgi:ring-1,2-phenylacetyl-CoA epoxidase subunit PaaE